ncbi:zinc metalloprotease HtpX [Geminicoccaceae bacterium 1502E]|nr:zinc metalloprotease HtpX [Geminicoccaceae bacterium 1502E]
MTATRAPLGLDRQQHLRHRLRNLVHTALLIGGMLAILGACAWILWGPVGLVWTLAVGGASLLATPSITPELVMRLYGARPVAHREFPDGYALLDELARRAGLPHTPRLHYIPSSLLNAFAVGNRSRAAIAVTAGLLRGLSGRELAGVLAHEISHVRHNDLWLMGLADLLSRLTSVMSWIGQLLLLINLPLMLTGAGSVPWLLVLLLIFAPTVVSLLQLALSRSREFDADLEAASLTGDPRGLASALARLERQQGRYWEEILLPGRRMPEPSLLRTHPPTGERVRRLLELEERPDLAPSPALRLAPGHWVHRAGTAPRWRWPGVWY